MQQNKIEVSFDTFFIWNPTFITFTQQIMHVLFEISFYL